MTTTTPSREALKRARAGARFLDKKLGRGWRRKIKRSRLDQARGLFRPSEKGSCGCILSQLDSAKPTIFGEGLYYKGAENLGLADAYSQRAANLGFFREPFTPDGGPTYADLTAAWKQILREGK